MPNALFVLIDGDTELCDQNAAPALQQCRALRRLRPLPQSICIARRQLTLSAGKLFVGLQMLPRGKRHSFGLEVRVESSELDNGSDRSRNLFHVQRIKPPPARQESFHPH